MKNFIQLWAFIASIIGLTIVTTPVYAKGAAAGAARAAPAVRSTPTTTRSYSSSSYTRRQAVVPSTPVTKRKRDDDVECSTLRYSRYSSDREVYRRYC